MLQQDKSDDYVLATGVTTTVREFIEKTFLKAANITIRWENDIDGNVTGINEKDDTIIVRTDKKYFRPCEVNLLLGDPTKAREKLGWEIEYDLNKLIDDMLK